MLPELSARLQLQLAAQLADAFMAAYEVIDDAHSKIRTPHGADTRSVACLVATSVIAPVMLAAMHEAVEQATAESADDPRMSATYGLLVTAVHNASVLAAKMTEAVIMERRDGEHASAASSFMC